MATRHHHHHHHQRRRHLLGSTSTATFLLLLITATTTAVAQGAQAESSAAVDKDNNGTAAVVEAPPPPSSPPSTTPTTTPTVPKTTTLQEMSASELYRMVDDDAKGGKRKEKPPATSAEAKGSIGNGTIGNGVDDNQVVDVVAAAAAGNNSSSASSIKSVCGVCECTANKTDCSSRKLDGNLVDHQWPRTPIDLLTFEDNVIARVKAFPNATVRRLSLRHNRIERIDDRAFKELVNLTELDLSQNLLNFENLMPNALEGKFTPEAYQPLVKLKLLNLSSNQFHSLNHDLFEHLADLKILDLSNNPFVVFDHVSTIALSGIPYLAELYLHHCKLSNLMDMTLNSLRYLKKLDLSWNEFAKLPDALAQCPALEELRLDGNPIDELGYDDRFPAMPRLKRLRMSDMPRLATIQYVALSNLQALESLEIENCGALREIAETALVKRPKDGGATWPPIRNLFLANNSLRYLPAGLVARWDKVEKLRLLNNQWSCDCDNQYFIGTLLPQQGERLLAPGELANLSCASPPEHRNRSLRDLAHHDLRCLDRYDARPERDAAVLVGALIGVLIAAPLLLGLFLLWRRGYVFCGGDRGPAGFSRAFYRRAAPCDDDA